MSAHRLAVVLPPDFTLFGLGVAVEGFTSRRPDHDEEWYDVVVCTARPGAVTAMRNLFGATITHGLEVIDDADTVVLPQAATLDRPAEPDVIEAVRGAARRGTRLVSFGSGTFVLAAAGVLDGRRATTHWAYAERLARSYPRVRVDPEALYVDEGQVLTAAGTAAAIDLCLHIICLDHGVRVARDVARHMVAAPFRDGGQAQFIMPRSLEAYAAEDGIGRVMRYALAHLEEELRLDDLATMAAMPVRTFCRRFREVTGTTPVKWLNHQRLARVREMLEETDLPVERIARVCGFQDAATLRQRFAQHLFTSPTAYRRAFRIRPNLVGTASDGWIHDMDVSAAGVPGP